MVYAHKTVVAGGSGVFIETAGETNSDSNIYWIERSACASYNEGDMCEFFGNDINWSLHEHFAREYSTITANSFLFGFTIDAGTSD